MHAIAAVHSFDRAGFEAQNRELHERIIPMLRHQPGFVSGTWSCDRAASRYHTFLVFESESHATKIAEFMRESSGESSVVLESLSIAEILAEAGAP